MKKIFLIIITLLLFSGRLFSNDLLRNAERAYDSKNYPEAIKNYEKLIAEGFRSYQLYFNLGNSYYRNNQLGKAIYNYELARKMSPTDEDISINLAIASAKTIDKIDAKENFFVSAVKTSLLSSFSTSTWGWLSVVFVFLSVIFFFVFVDSRKLLVKRISFISFCVFFALFITSYLLGYSALSARYENKFAIIISKEIRIMNEPTTMAKTKFLLHEGTKIRVVENNGDWVLIKLDNGNEGWVKISDVGII